MAFQYQAIRFSASIKDEKYRPIERLEVNIQFFESIKERWTNLFESSLKMEEGRISILRRLPYSDSDGNFTPIDKNIQEIFKIGGVPIFRLIKGGEVKPENVEVLAYVKNIDIDNEKEPPILHLNFGELFLLEKKFWGNIGKEGTKLTTLNLPLEPFKEEEQKLRVENAVLKDEIKRLGGYKEKLEDLQIDYNKLKQELQALQVEYDKLKQESKALQIDYDKLKLELEQRVNCEEDLAALQIEYDALKLELESLRDCQQALEALRIEYDKLKLQYDALKEELEEKNAEIEALKELLEDQDPPTNEPVPAHTIYTNILSEVSSVNESMTNSGYKLANISVNLKTLVTQSEDGLIFQPINSDLASEVNGAAVSDINIDVAETPTTSSQEALIPNVIGLTETATRKLLMKYKLRIDPVYQYMDIENNNYTIGQAFKQHPAAGTEVITDEIITVVFAKKRVTV